MAQRCCSTTRWAICAALIATAVAIGLIITLSYVYWWPTDQSCPPGDVDTGYTARGEVVTVNTDVVAYLSKPDGRVERSCKGAIVVAHDIYGYELPDNQAVADNLARNGYVAILPDLYRGDPWRSDRDGSEFAEWRSNHTQERVDADIDATMNFVKSNLGIDNIGFVGFCWGGLQAVLASGRLDIDVAVAFYGVSMLPDHLLAMKKPTLLIHGENDTVTTMDDVRLLESTLRDANRLLQGVDDTNTAILSGPPAYVKVFEGVGHAFAHRGDMGDPLAQAASQEAFRNMYSWLAR